METTPIRTFPQGCIFMHRRAYAGACIYKPLHDYSGNMRIHEYLFFGEYVAASMIQRIGWRLRRHSGAAPYQGMRNMAMLSAKDVAIQLDVDAKTFRRFVRSYVKRSGGVIGQDTPGRGGRYAFDEDEMDAIRDAFAAWRTMRSGQLVTFTLEANDELLNDE